jgi:hypothetical protein
MLRIETLLKASYNLHRIQSRCQGEKNIYLVFQRKLCSIFVLRALHKKANLKFPEGKAAVESIRRLPLNKPGLPDCSW